MARRAMGPATLAGVQAVESALGPADAALLVACSGGPDSLALAVAAQQAGRRRSLPVSAVVVDHGLQPDSAEVAADVRQRLLGLGLDAAVRRVSVHADGSGPEAAARGARYAALDAEAGRRSATVLLGHSLDDQAETVLLGLARGSGTRSLAGMAPRSGRLLRPFLGLRRSVTAAICAEAGLRPWTDPHNSDPAYVRVRVRTSVLPVLEAQLGPGVADALARTAALARQDADLLDALAADADPGTDSLDCAIAAALPAALRSRVLQRWLRRRGAADLSRRHLAEVDALLVGWRGQGPLQLPGVSVARQDDRLWCS
jgi:tRNA(Ile)-lysidine synthase